jgi:hypothetical protein
LVFLVLLTIIGLLSGCSSIPVSTSANPDLPPILAQDELLRPYIITGRIQVKREAYFTDYDIEPNLQKWGYRALQEEAAKIGADAVIFPEITTRATTIFIFPTTPATEYRATGVAIKFK